MQVIRVGETAVYMMNDGTKRQELKMQDNKSQMLLLLQPMQAVNADPLILTSNLTFEPYILIILMIYYTHNIRLSTFKIILFIKYNIDNQSLKYIMNFTCS